MTQPHVIRLRGPWECTPLVRWTRGPQGQVLTSSEGLPAGGKTPMPADWGALLGADFRGRVRYLRRFHAPTNLDVRDSVFLAFDGVDLRGEATLNRAALGAIEGPLAAARFDITSLLKLRNQLIVEVELPPLDAAEEETLRAGRAGSPGGIVGDVRLEIVQAGPPADSDSLQAPSDA